jgi:hypothetical protein
MRTFNLGAVYDWRLLPPAEGFIFGAAKPRRVTVEFMASAPIEAYLTDPGDEGGDVMLIAVGDGHMQATFTIARDMALQLAAPEGAIVYIRTSDGSHVVSKSGAEKYTKLHVARPPTEYERMMRFAQLNQLHMEERMRAEMARLRDDLATRRQEPTPNVPNGSPEPAATDGSGTPEPTPSAPAPAAGDA